jgi:S1-C subfamily serine protease
MFKKRMSLSIPAALVLAVLLITLAFGANSLAGASQAQAASASLPQPVTAAAKQGGSNSLVGLYKSVHASVVEVVNLAQNSQYSSTPVEQALGSGFVWDSNGDIVTNDHVVQGADALQVLFADGTRLNATLVGTDPSADLAVLRVDPRAATLQPIAQGDMSQVEVGEDVIAIGTPFGYQGTLTVGIVSGLGRTISSQTQFSIPNAIQTDAAINPGNSGGPLLNLQGQVIGVNDQIQSSSGSSSGVGFAIPISIVQRVVPAVIKNGSYAHAYLGVSGDTYNSMWASELGLPANAKGVYVVGVAQGGPAEQAGLRGGTQNSGILLSAANGGGDYLASGGDLITAIDGQAVNSMDQLMTYLSEKTSPNQTVRLTVIRPNSGQGTLNVTLGVQPDNSGITQTSN